MVKTYEIQCKGYKLGVCKRCAKALEQEACDDCISRQAVLKPYQTLDDSETLSIWLIRKNIEQTPSVAPQTRWIPVSERLPEENGRYLCTYKGNFGSAFLCVDFGSYKNGEWYVDGVIAWTPLPEPYKAESEGTSNESKDM